MPAIKVVVPKFFDQHHASQETFLREGDNLLYNPVTKMFRASRRWRLDCVLPGTDSRVAEWDPGEGPPDEVATAIAYRFGFIAPSTGKTKDGHHIWTLASL